jgi:hypothetical protein
LKKFTYEPAKKKVLYHTKYNEIKKIIACLEKKNQSSAKRCPEFVEGAKERCLF